jgi:predicted phosphodiesterase
MRILVISDIHGNLPALEFVLKLNRDVDAVISLGDVVNYGPWSDECVRLLDSLDNMTTIVGNHETAFINGVYPGTNQIAKSFFNFCQPRFSEKKIIAGYKGSFFINQCRFIHTINENYIFPDTAIDLTEDTFIGHSHRLFLRYSNGFKLVNAGSVGQNRANINEVNFVIWDSKDGSIDLCSRNFNSSSLLISEMKKAKYPDICINYILSKKVR